MLFHLCFVLFSCLPVYSSKVYKNNFFFNSNSLNNNLIISNTVFSSTIISTKQENKNKTNNYRPKIILLVELESGTYESSLHKNFLYHRIQVSKKF